MLKKPILALVAAALLAGCTCAPKVEYKIWHDWPERYLPDFSTFGEPDIQGTKVNIDLMDIDDTRNHFAVLFETKLKVQKEEVYTFKVSSDDGTKLYIDGDMIIVNDGAHGPILKTAEKPLGKGVHDIRLEFFDYDKGQSLTFTYFTPTIPERELNDRLKQQLDRQTSRHAFVKPQVREAYKRFAAWKGDDVTLVYPILTDVHTAERFSYKHVGFARWAAYKFGADFMANLGDIGLNAYPATLDSREADKIVAHIRQEMDRYDGMWIYAPGNHDWDAGEGKYNTDEFLSETFQKPWEKRAGGNLHLTPGKVYGYYDIPEKKFRVIFLNSEGSGTQEGYYYYFDDPQLDWLRGVLDATPEETNVIVMAHYMPHPMGRWTTSSAKPQLHRLDQNDKLMDMLAEYKEKGCRLVGMITGDSHTNDYAEYKGVDYFVSQGYGWVVPDLMLPTNRHAFYDYKESLCIDVVAVKPEKREVHTFRIGAGGADFDCGWEY